jgi:tetratricopeptide (TPR) repeat protein
MNPFIGFLVVRWRLKGQKLLQQGKSEKAKRLFEKVLMYDQAPENLFNYALSLMNLFEYEKAIAYFEKIRMQNEDYFLNNLSLGESYLITRQWNKAKELFYELSQKNPDNMAYKNYFVLANDVVKREKYVAVKNYLDDAVKLLKKSDYISAIEKLNKAELMAPEIPMIKNSLGEIYFLMKDYDKAFEYFKKVIAMEPDNPKYQKNWRKILRYKNK